MISKVAVYGRDRNEAIGRMQRALQEYEIAGVKTTIPFFRDVMNDQEFINGQLDTGFIGHFLERREIRPVNDADDQIVRSDLAIISAALCSTKAPTKKPPTALQ